MAAAEQIEQFITDVTVQPDGSLRIAEEIRYDFGDLERRGILRTLPLTHPQESGTWYKDRVIDVSVDYVLRDGQSEPYQVTESGNELMIRIGDPHETITGVHDYLIRYDVAGALTYYEDGTVDLYWNVTGDEWAVPIASTSATVAAPAGALLPTEECYVGRQGATTPCADILVATNTVMFLSDRLAPGTGLTIAQALDPNVVEQQIIEQWNLWWLWLTLGILWLIGAGGYAHRHHTYHNPRATIIARYEPYQDVKPMFAGLLIDGQLNSRDITAGLLYLAEQGFIKIRKTERKVMWLFETSDYEIDLLRKPRETETTFQHELLKLLFGTNGTVGTTMTLSSLKRDESKQRANQRILTTLRSSLNKDLVARGFYENAYQRKLHGLIFSVIALIVLTASVAQFTAFDVTFFVVLTMLTFCTLVIFAIVSKRRTTKGYEARNHLEGFKQFLSVTGQDRFAFHDAPEKSPKQFTEFLPYAVAFGVEKEWAEVFADLTIPQPSWYEDGSGTGYFPATALVSDLGGFSSSFASSSGTSASSGGGSAGGGAGGGGGGSW
jgi:uncharacterized membrane protein